MESIVTPGFIGHPGCFQPLMQRLRAPFQTINYHSLPRTRTMPSMAEHIATRISPPTWIIGYSFGGALGYELCQYFRDSLHLIMVDSHIHNCDSVFLFLGAGADYRGLEIEVSLDGDIRHINSPASVFIPAGVAHSYRFIRGCGTYINFVHKGDYHDSLLEITDETVQ